MCSVVRLWGSDRANIWTSVFPNRVEFDNVHKNNKCIVLWPSNPMTETLAHV